MLNEDINKFLPVVSQEKNYYLKSPYEEQIFWLAMSVSTHLKFPQKVEILMFHSTISNLSTIKLKQEKGKEGSGIEQVPSSP